MTTVDEVTPLGRISAWSAVSPYGIGRGSLADGILSQESRVHPVDGDKWVVPQRGAAVVPNFDIRTVLGPKRTRSMDRITGLAVSAVGRLLEEVGGRAALGADEDVALVLGTDTGSLQSMMDFTRDSLVGDKPYHVDPSRFPNAVMNCAAGQSAIWHTLRGPNATVSGGRVAGLLALKYALRIQRSGQASTVICGAAEEFSVARSWLDWHSTGVVNRPESVHGEGCVVFLLEPVDIAPDPSRPVIAEILALQFGVHYGQDSVGEVLVRCVRTALRESGVEPDDVSVVATSDAVDSFEATALDEVFGWDRSTRFDLAGLVGDVGAAAAAFQIAGVLARGSAHESTVGLVTAVDRDGVVGCLVLRVLS